MTLIETLQVAYDKANDEVTRLQEELDNLDESLEKAKKGLEEAQSDKAAAERFHEKATTDLIELDQSCGRQENPDQARKALQRELDNLAERQRAALHNIATAGEVVKGHKTRMGDLGRDRISLKKRHQSAIERRDQIAKQIIAESK
jgi:hypothetical protein